MTEHTEEIQALELAWWLKRRAVRHRQELARIETFAQRCGLTAERREKLAVMLSSGLGRPWLPPRLRTRNQPKGATP